MWKGGIFLIRPSGVAAGIFLYLRGKQVVGHLFYWWDKKGPEGSFGDNQTRKTPFLNMLIEILAHDFLRIGRRRH